MPGHLHASTWARTISRLAALGAVCAWLVPLSGCEDGCGCEAFRTSQRYKDREYEMALVDELCTPGGFYRECVWPTHGLCYDQMDQYANSCVGMSRDPGYVRMTQREAALHCVFWVHFVGLAAPLEKKQECLDVKRWEHLPPAYAEEWMTSLQEWWQESESAPPVTPDAAPVSPDAAPDSSGL